MNRQRLSRVILNPGTCSEVLCDWFMEDAYLPRVVCTVFGFARNQQGTALEICLDIYEAKEILYLRSQCFASAYWH